MQGPRPAIAVQVHADEAAGEDDRDYARAKVARAAQRAWGPVLFARIDLRWEANRSQSRPATAKVLVDVNGTPVLAHADAPSLHEAIDLVEDRLAHRLDHTSSARRH
jgi:ribosome-associated translation inhibitor RaiA